YEFHRPPTLRLAKIEITECGVSAVLIGCFSGNRQHVMQAINHQLHAVVGVRKRLIREVRDLARGDEWVGNIRVGWHALFLHFFRIFASIAARSSPSGMMKRQRPLLRDSQTAPMSRFSLESLPVAKWLPLYSTTRIRPSMSSAMKSG